ncbi:peptidase domain-containing ABC transporter, partial [Rhodobaculum claviforme]|uniref:Uncharacterized protein n=1 Tax=Rhodobaculum claviforme TaxID=1549854 RepID=A0A934WI19_9RHOB
MTAAQVAIAPPSGWGADASPDTDAARTAAIAASLGALAEGCALARALGPLLAALGWDGPPRTLAEALPHFEDRLDLVALRDVMALLGYASTVLPDTRADRIDARLMPALMLPRDGRALVLLGPGGPRREVRVHDPALDGPARRHARHLRGDICLFERIEGTGDARAAAEAGRWVGFVMARFRGLYARVAALTFLIYLLAVAPALFIMALYDRVIPAGSLPTLVSLLVGVAVALLGEAVLRSLRGRMLARLGARITLLLSGGVFAHLLALPVAISERMRMGARVQRLRQSEGVRDALAGSAAITVIELPFAAVFLAALALLGGTLALVPLAAVGVYGLAALVLAPALRGAAAAQAQTAMARQDFLFEAIAHGEDIRLAGAAPRWRARFRMLSGAAAHAGHRAQTLAALVTAVGQIVMVSAGLLTVGLGALAMMEGALSMGALIAIMTLTWRALAPIQAAFVLLTRFDQLRGTIASIDRAMKTPPEGCATTRRGDIAPLRAGGLSLVRVSFKYAAELDPAAMAISAEIAPGEIIAITGPNGAGKSTLLKLLLGLHAPQAGTIVIDGIDTRQHAPVALRQAIGYVPQEFELFFGTVEQNLRLSMPTATPQQIDAAIRRAGIGGLIRRLPGGLAHRVGDGRSGQVSSSLVNGLGLAAAYLREPRLLLLDEAIDNLDPDLTAVFHDQLAEFRGAVTTLMVTHRPATMRLADRVIVLNGGSVVRAAPPAALM